jgi:fumarylacetoacetase
VLDHVAEEIHAADSRPSVTASVNSTHDPALRSWVSSANLADTDFPIQNLPFAIFRGDQREAFRGGVAIGDEVVDLHALRLLDSLEGDAAAALEACCEPSLIDL